MMYAVTIRDGAAGTGTMQLNLYEVLTAIGEVAERLFWEITSVNLPEKHFLNEFDVVGAAEPEFNALRSAGKRISGADLKMLSLKDHQLIWAELRGYSGKRTSKVKAVIRAVDSTYFEVVSADDKVVDRLTKRFVLVEVSSANPDPQRETTRLA